MNTPTEPIGSIPRVLEGIADGFFVLDTNWNFTYANRRAEETFSLSRKSRESIIGRNLWEEFPALLGTPFERAYRRAVDEQTTVEIEAYYPPRERWFAVRAHPSSDGLSIYFHDATSRKEAEIALELERASLQMIVAGEPLAAVLDRLARDAESQSRDGMLCSILLLDETGERLVHGAAPSLPAAYNAAIDGTRIGPSVGSCGTAAFRGRPVWVSDIANDPLWADFKELARTHGLAACCSTPMYSPSGAVSGTIAMYFREAREPSAHDVRVIELTTHLAAIVVERHRAQRVLRESEERLRATFEQAAVGIAVAALDGRFLQMNRKFRDILGYSEAHLREVTFKDITHPDDLPATASLVAQLLDGSRSEYSVEKRYLRSDGTPVWSHTTVSLLRGPDGSAQRFVGVIEDITHRKATEEALLRSEQFNRGIVESSRECIKTLTLDGVITWISDSGRRVLSIGDPASVLGNSWIDFWKGEDRNRARAAVAAAAEGGSGSFVGNFEIAGEPRWWDVVITPVRDRDGRPESLLAVSRDVTERMAAQARLRDSEEQLLLLANSIPQLAWMARPDGHIFWYNEGWYRYTGTTLEQMQGWGWQSVHDPDILPAVLERWKASIASGEPFEMEFPLRAADGAFRWFLTRVNPMRDASGNVVRWFGTNTDVDQVRRVRRELEDETRILEILNATGTKLAASLDVQDLLQSITDAATQLSGAKFGAFFYNVVNDDGEAFMLYTLSGAPRSAFEKFGQPRATPIFAPTFRGEGVVRVDDVRKDPRYGHMAPHHGMPKGHLPVRSYLAVPVPSRSGEVIGGLFFGHPEPGMFTERSERLVVGVAAQAGIALDNARLYSASQKSAEERRQLLESERHARTAAERANRMKDEFLATLSHELRTPLSAILGWSQLLRGRKVPEEDLLRGLEIIERNARVQTQLIEDLLDMSRITSGKVRLDVQPVFPSALIQAALETVRPAAEAKDIRIEQVLDPGAGPVSGDPNRLQQVVWNLLVNAIKFTPKGGRLQVVLARVDSHVEISVSDTGVGIPPEFIDHVFERFRQADSSTTRQHGGLGLGLAIVKHLIELHGGSVFAKSEGAGRGSTFYVTLPLAIATRAAGRDAGEHPRAPQAAALDFKAIDLSGLTVLVVDDQPDARELASRVLSECGAHVLVAESGAKALELVQSERPDVLVSDLGMPEMDGFELLRRVRALGDERGGKTPAIALTAFARSQDRTRVLHHGFQVHVAKPVEPAELIATVGSVAGRTGPQ